MGVIFTADCSAGLVIGFSVETSGVVAVAVGVSPQEKKAMAIRARKRLRMVGCLVVEPGRRVLVREE